MNDKISNMALVNENFVALRAQVEDLQTRERTSSYWTSRSDSLNQTLTLRNPINDKEKTVKFFRENSKFKTVEDADAHIRNLEVQARSGVMKDTEERRTLREIDDAKRIRKVVESFQAESDAIDADHAAIRKLNQPLGDREAGAEAEARAIFERRLVLQAKMNVMKREVDLLGDLSLPFELQRKLQRLINTLFSERYDLISRLREDDTQYYAMLNEDSYRAEWRSAEREAEVEDQIDDCQTLIEYLSGISTSAMVNSVPLVKTGEEEADYFVGIKDSSTVTGEMSSSSSIDLPFYMGYSLHSLSILPPSSLSDVPRVVEKLKTRKARLEVIAKIQENLLGRAVEW